MNGDDRDDTVPRATDADPRRRSLLTGATAIGAAALAGLLAQAGGAARAQDVQDQDLTTDDMVGKVLRVYHTGDPITMDYSENRLNIELGPDDLIARVWIG